MDLAEAIFGKSPWHPLDEKLYCQSPPPKDGYPCPSSPGVYRIRVVRNKGKPTEKYWIPYVGESSGLPARFRSYVETGSHLRHFFSLIRQNKETGLEGDDDPSAGPAAIEVQFVATSSPLVAIYLEKALLAGCNYPWNTKSNGSVAHSVRKAVEEGTGARWCSAVTRAGNKCSFRAKHEVKGQLFCGIHVKTFERNEEKRSTGRHPGRYQKKKAAAAHPATQVAGPVSSGKRAEGKTTPPDKKDADDHGPVATADV